MRFNQLRDFLAVAERGSLRAAARHLDLAQPTLTRSIHELERELGATLFERQSKGMTLTPTGEILRRRATSVTSEMRRIKEEIDQLRGNTQGKVTVCLSSVPHIALLPHALGAFRQRYPDVHLDVFDGLFPGTEAALKEGSVDCYFGPVPTSVASHFVVEKLFDNTRVILCRNGHPLQNARSLKELVDAHWLGTSITPKAEDELGPLFASHGLPAPHLVMQAHSALTFVVSAVYSDVLLMLPVQWTQFELTRNMLRRIDVAEPLLAPPISLVTRAGLPLTPAAEYFCDMMRRAAEHMRRDAEHGIPPSR